MSVKSLVQHAGRNHNINIGNNSSEKAEQFRYLGTTITNQNTIPEEINSKVGSGNACYHSVQNILSSRLLSKNIKIQRTTILPAVMYGCGTWSLALREERMLRVFENRVLRGIFGPVRDKITVERRKLHNKELNYLYCSPNIIWMIKSRGMSWAGHVTHIEERCIHGFCGET